MATFQVYVAFDANNPTGMPADFITAAFSNPSPTSFTMTFPTGYPGYTMATVGTGFTFGSDGVVTGGTITDATTQSVDHLGATAQNLYRINGMSASMATEATFGPGDGSAELRYWLGGNDTITGSSGNDTLFGAAGDDSVDGGTGVNTAAFLGNRANYTITSTATGFTVKDNLAGANNEGTDTLSNIQKFNFADVNIDPATSAFFKGPLANYTISGSSSGYTIVDTVGSEGTVSPSVGKPWHFADGSVSFVAPTSRDLTAFSGDIPQRLEKFYIAYYGRAADYGGLRYWADTLQTVLGGSQLAMAQYFGTPTQVEFTNLYGANVDNATFLDNVYQNLFNRPADSSGSTYWQGVITDKVAAGQSLDSARAEVVIQVMDGAQPADAALVAAKVTNATLMSQQIAQYDVTNVYGDANSASTFAAARAWLAGEGSSTHTASVSAVLPFDVMNIIGQDTMNTFSAGTSATLPTVATRIEPRIDTGVSLTGNAGNNILQSNSASCSLTGGGGADVFIIDKAPGAATADTITDFAPGADVLVLNHANLSAAAAGAVAATQFVTGTAATTAAQVFVYNSSTGALYFDADGSGAGAAVLVATLSNHPALTSADLWLI